MSQNTIGWVQSGIFLVQTAVFGYQALKLRETVAASAKQSRDSEESIRQATRAADAMVLNSENVVTLTENSNRQLRAYLSVQISSGVYQDANCIFEVLPLLANVGYTPALRVRYAARAEIFPFPLPDEFTFPPLHPPGPSFGVLPPHQNFTMNARLDRRLEDHEAEAIKRSQGRRLYIWGTVFYDDTFGSERYTNFAHSIFWVRIPNGDELVRGHYADRHNEAI